LNFQDKFLKTTQIENITKSVQWEPSCSMRTDRQIDGQTDVMKLIVAFRGFANATKTSSSYSVGCNSLCVWIHNYARDTNVICGQNVEFLIAKLDGIWSCGEFKRLRYLFSGTSFFS